MESAHCAHMPAAETHTARKMYDKKPLRRPHWLRKKIRYSCAADTQSAIRARGLNTVCEEARCPNITECFSRGVATFLIMGRVCTRRCGFCNIGSGTVQPLDRDEPKRIGKAVRTMNLRHAVITSVTRDDIEDGGAEHFALTVKEVRKAAPSAGIELLIPDMMADEKSLRVVCDSGPDIIGHNIETAPHLYSIRSGADYDRSVRVLAIIRKHARKSRIKSGIMLGLGETHGDIMRVLKDIAGSGCDFLSIGQYLRPSLSHAPVRAYYTPGQFEMYARHARMFGIQYVKSGPFVRSSYLADEYPYAGNVWKRHLIL